MTFHVIEPKYLMLNGKNAFPGITYENFLIDVINGSPFFRSKLSFMEQYRLNEHQDHGEDDVYSSTYQFDFKLLVDEDIMRERYRNMPEIDYSQMSKGFIFSKTKEKVSEIPVNHILKDIESIQIDDLRNGIYKNKTIERLIKNLCKPKNIFIYYPYEYTEVTNGMMRGFDEAVTHIFENVLAYRDELDMKKDTFICFKINQFFIIMEWINKKLIFRDKVDDILCANYRDAKTYSVY